jgi:hypothetical protein
MEHTTIPPQSNKSRTFGREHVFARPSQDMIHTYKASPKSLAEADMRVHTEDQQAEALISSRASVAAKRWEREAGLKEKKQQVVDFNVCMFDCWVLFIPAICVHSGLCAGG